jgi:hypothetical protein
VELAQVDLVMLELMEQQTLEVVAVVDLIMVTVIQEDLVVLV